MIKSHAAPAGAKDRICSTFRQQVWYALDFDMLESAEFAAERLLALDESKPSSRHLMGLVMFRMGKYKRGAMVTANTAHVGCAFIYAKCCFKLKTYSVGIETLERFRYLWDNKQPVERKSSDLERSFEPSSCVADLLLGQLYKARNDRNKAAKAFGLSAQANPYLWESLKGIADMGLNVNTKKLFKKMDETGQLSANSSVAATNTASSAVEDDPFAAPTAPVSSSTASTNPQGKMLFKTSQSFLKSNRDLMNTPIGNAHDDAFNTTPSDGSKNKPSMMIAPNKRTGRTTSTSDKPPLFEPTNRRQMRPSTQAKRLAHERQQPNKPGSSSSTSSTASSALTNPSTISRGKLKMVDRDTSTQDRVATKYVNDLFSKLAQAYTLFCMFDCDKALQILETLAPEQQQTPWVLGKMARLHFEKVSYSESERFFQKLRELDPCRVEDMEYYSTLLWHLRDEVALGYLAHELIDLNRTAPEAWCALGNCFSLQRDADQALKCFNRAIQLDPDSAYAYTLRAHEHIANDSYENGQECFRLAIRVDNRHYNAWYGLGMVFMRLGDIDGAELHFNRAMSINPCNVVLICCMGMVMEKRNKHHEALQYFKKGVRDSAKERPIEIQKARTLLNLNQYSAALIEFHELKNMAPNEASVHYMMGQLYKQMDSRDLAVKHFTIALNLDPKGAHIIKESLENLAPS